jgi:hypothetical protein
MDPIKNMERAIEMLSVSCDLVAEEENSLLKQIIKQIDQVLHKTTPELTPEPVTPTTEMNNNLTTILKAIDSNAQVEAACILVDFIGSSIQLFHR